MFGFKLRTNTYTYCVLCTGGWGGGSLCSGHTRRDRQYKNYALDCKRNPLRFDNFFRRECPQKPLSRSEPLTPRKSLIRLECNDFIYSKFLSDNLIISCNIINYIASRYPSCFWYVKFKIIILSHLGNEHLFDIQERKQVMMKATPPCGLVCMRNVFAGRHLAWRIKSNPGACPRRPGLACRFFLWGEHTL